MAAESVVNNEWDALIQPDIGKEWPIFSVTSNSVREILGPLKAVKDKTQTRKMSSWDWIFKLEQETDKLEMATFRLYFRIIIRPNDLQKLANYKDDVIGYYQWN